MSREHIITTKIPAQLRARGGHGFATLDPTTGDLTLYLDPADPPAVRDATAAMLRERARDRHTGPVDIPGPRGPQ